jgi:tyrosinase
VNQLYGQTAPARIVNRRWFRGRRGRRPRSLGVKHLVARENKTDPTPLDTPQGLVGDDGKYYEYIANIRVKKFALKGSFFVHLFLGDFDPNPAKWTFEPNLIGSHCVFSNTPESCSHCKSQAAKDLEVTGTIPLTTALLNAIKRGHLPSLEPKDVDPFLQRNLHWRVSMLDDKCVQNTQVPGLKVAVLSSEVKKPERPDEFPEWGSLSPREDVTRNKTTGYSHSDRL